jgi:hypothetical protein
MQTLSKREEGGDRGCRAGDEDEDDCLVDDCDDVDCGKVAVQKKKRAEDERTEKRIKNERLICELIEK